MRDPVVLDMPRRITLATGSGIAAKGKQRLFGRQRAERVYLQAAGSDEAAQGALGDFSVIGDRQRRHVARLD